MDEILKKLQQFDIAQKFAQLGGSWSPEIGKELQNFLATHGVEVSLEDLYDFLHPQSSPATQAVPLSAESILVSRIVGTQSTDELEESRIEEANLADEIEEIEELDDFDEAVENATLAEGKSAPQLTMPEVQTSLTSNLPVQDNVAVQAIEELPSAIFNIGENVLSTSSPAMPAVPLSDEEVRDMGNVEAATDTTGGDAMATVVSRPSLAKDQAAPTEAVSKDEMPELIATRMSDKLQEWEEPAVQDHTNSSSSPDPRLIAALAGETPQRLPTAETPELLSTSVGDKEGGWEEEIAAEAVEDFSKELAAIESLTYGSSAAMPAVPLAEDEENLLAQGLVIDGDESAVTTTQEVTAEQAGAAILHKPIAVEEGDDQVMISSEILVEEKETGQHIVNEESAATAEQVRATPPVQTTPTPESDQNLQGILVEPESHASVPAASETRKRTPPSIVAEPIPKTQQRDDIFEDILVSPAAAPEQSEQNTTAEPADIIQMPTTAPTPLAAEEEAAHQQKIIDMEIKAEDHWQSKHFPEAITIWNELLAFEDIPEIHEKISAAEQQMQQASQLWGNAQFLAECDKDKDAVQILRQCLAIYPYHESARQLLTHIETQISANEGQLMELFVQGQKFLQEKQYKKARELWKKAEKFLPENSHELADWALKTSNMIIEAILSEGRQYLKRKDLARAYELWKQGKELLPDAPEIEQELKKTDTTLQSANNLFAKSQALYSAFDLAKAREALHACLKIYPDYPESGVLEAQISEAMAKQSEYQTILAEGELLAEAKQFAEAIAVWQQAVGLIPTDSAAQEKIHNAEAEIAQQEQQRADYIGLWEQAEEAENQQQYEKALLILTQIHTKSWDFDSYDRELEEQFWNRLQQIQQTSQQVSAQIKSTASYLAQRPIKETKRFLASEIFQQPVTETVQQELAAIQEQVQQLGLTKAFRRKIAAASLIVSLFAWQWLAIAFIPKDWLTRQVDNKPSREEILLGLKREAAAALQQQNWETAKALYGQLKLEAPTADQSEIELALASIAREEAWLANLHTARELAQNKNWPQLRKTLQELKATKPDWPELQSLEKAIPALPPQVQLRIAVELKEVGEYRATLQQELDKLQNATLELSSLAKYAKIPPEIKAVMQTTQMRVHAIGEAMEASKNALEKNDESMVPRDSLHTWQDPAILNQLKVAQNKLTAASKEAKQWQTLENTCHKGISYLQKKAKELETQREKVEEAIAKMQQYPANRGFKQLPEKVASVLNQLKKDERELKQLLSAFNQVIEKAVVAQYPAFIQKTKEAGKSAGAAEAGKIVPEVEAVLSANQRLAQNPSFMEKDEREAWQKQHPDIGNKILGTWYAQLDRTLQEYEKVSRRAPQYMKTPGARKIYLMLGGQIATLQRYAQEVSKLEWKIYRLEQGGMKLEEALKLRRESVVMPTQIKQINALRRYLSTRKFDVDMSAWVSEINTAVEKLFQEVAKQNVEEATVRDIYRATQRIDDNFWEYFRSLDSELSNLQAGQNK
jgi:uncharacterized protein YdbL (DUF1318 family)